MDTQGSLSGQTRLRSVNAECVVAALVCRVLGSGEHMAPGPFSTAAHKPPQVPYIGATRTTASESIYVLHVSPSYPASLPNQSTVVSIRCVYRALTLTDIQSI